MFRKLNDRVEAFLGFSEEFFGAEKVVGPFERFQQFSIAAFSI